MNNIIVAKTSLDIVEMKSKVKCGFSNFELHLDETFQNSNIAKYNEMANDIKDILPDVVAVHTPLDSTTLTFGADSVDIARSLTNDNMRIALEKTCFFADIIADVYGHSVIVITHMSDSFKDLSHRGVLKGIVEYVDILTSMYKNIVIGIENVTPTEKGVMGEISLRNGILHDPIKLAKHLNENCNSENKGKFVNVLDICHMITTIKMLNAIGVNAPKLTEMIIAYSNSCNYIHLANVEEFGTKPKQHGTGFTNDEVCLDYILHLLDNHMGSPTLCLEMQEDDYQNPSNAIHAKDFINERIRHGKAQTY